LGEPAPLIGIEAAPVPSGGAAEWVFGVGGLRLRVALFPSTASPSRGSVIISPGRTEAIEKYFEVVETLQRRGFTVLVHDWRGQGLSQRLLPNRRLGHAEASADDFLGDLDLLLTAFTGRLPKPWITLAHSMGGGLCLLSLARGETRFSAGIFSAPMTGINLGRLPLAAARAMAGAAMLSGRGARLARPDAPAPTPFDENLLTHDPVRYARALAQIAACPDLDLGGPTWGWISFALALQRELAGSHGLARITAPLAFVVAGEERLVDNAATRRLADLIPAARYVEAAGAYHEILQETDPVRELFWREFDALVERI